MLPKILFVMHGDKNLLSLQYGSFISTVEILLAL